MFNKMFFNIGKSIKSIAVIIFFIEIISGVFGGLAMIFNAEYFWIVLDCGDKMGLQNCSKCGCPINSCTKPLRDYPRR